MLAATTKDESGVCGRYEHERLYAGKRCCAVIRFDAWEEEEVVRGVEEENKCNLSKKSQVRETDM
jgi:hypothetical protein